MAMACSQEQGTSVLKMAHVWAGSGLCDLISQLCALCLRSDLVFPFTWDS